MNATQQQRFIEDCIARILHTHSEDDPSGSLWQAALCELATFHNRLDPNNPFLIFNPNGSTAH